MTLLSALRLSFNSTTVRFIVFFLVFLNRVNADERLNWRRDSAREQQVAERIYQWQKRGHFNQQYCWQALRIDDRARQSDPELRIIAAHSDISDAQLRADYLRQQWFCLLQQHTTLRATAVERLRRHVPALRVTHGDLTTRYSELLAAQLTLQWLRANGEQKQAETAQQYWLQSRDGHNYATLWVRKESSERIAMALQRDLFPSHQQWATFKP